jgi:transposase
LSQVFSYALSQKERLKKYLENIVLIMDNNLAENAIRPFVVGLKNWMFSNQPHGAEAIAVLYSIIETAKANNLEPYHYLLY